MQLRPALIAFGLALIGAALEGILAGRGVRPRLAEFRQPAASPSLIVWGAIGFLYYATCFGIAYRLLSLDLAGEARIAFSLLLAVMLGNAFWNYTFFRRGDLHMTLWVTIAYGVTTVALFVALVRIDAFAAWLLVPYLVYSIYGAWWTFTVWRLNPGRSAA